MTKTTWGDIKTPLTATVPKSGEGGVEVSSLDESFIDTSGLENVVIVTDNGIKIPALVDQSSRTVYPKRNS